MSATERDRSEFLLERVQELQELLDSRGEANTRELADELVAAVVQMYGAGLERIMAVVTQDGAAGGGIAARLAEDRFVATLLLIHDLHPVPLEQRVRGALDSVRPYMESHGGNVELLSLEDGVARIHLRGSCSDCSASSVTLELAIKQALEDAAPDLLGLEVEGLSPSTRPGGDLEGVAPRVSGMPLPMAQPAAPAGVELPVVMAGGSTMPPTPTWVELDDVCELPEGSLRGIELNGRRLVVANVAGTLLAFNDSCAACGGPLASGLLSDGALSCPGCGRAYSLPRAGRSLDGELIQLEPVPLLREQGRVKVAVLA